MSTVLDYVAATNSLTVSNNGTVKNVAGSGVDNNFSVPQTFQAGITASGSTSLQAVSGTTGTFTGAVSVSGFSNAGPTSLQEGILQSGSAGTGNQSPLLNVGDAFSDFIADGMQWAIPSSASLTTSMASGTAYLNSVRTLVPAVSGYSFPASNDTYVSFNNSGVPAYQSVANGATAPTPNSGYVQTAKVVTSPIQSPIPTLTASTSGSLASGTYGIALVAYDATGYGAVGASGSVTVSASGSIEISWVNPLNETSMDIYATDEGGSTLGLVASGVTGNSYTYTGSAAPGAAAPTTATSNAVQSTLNILYSQPQVKNPLYAGSLVNLGMVDTFLKTTFVPQNYSGKNTTFIGSIAASSTTLILTSDSDFEDLQGITISGAAPSGSDFTTQVLSGSGTNTLILASAASTSVSGVTIFHDDTVSIQNALNVAGAHGGKVLLPPSTPQISSTLNIPDRVELHGASIQGTQIQSYQYSSRGGAKFSGFLLSGKDITNPVVKNISFRGPGLNGRAGSGITFGVVTADDVSGIILENVLVEQVPGSAVYLAHPVETTLTNVKVLNFGGNGISTYLGTSCTFNSCYALTGVGSGFLIKEGTYFSLNGCASETCGVDYDFLNSNNISLSGTGSEVPIYRSTSEPGIHYRFKHSTCIVLNGAYARDFATAQSASGANQYINMVNGSQATLIGFRGVSSTHAPTATYSVDGTSLLRLVDSEFIGNNSTVSSILPGGSVIIELNNISTLSGATSGSITFSMPQQGNSFKEVKLFLESYENNSSTAQSIDFPVPFSIEPLIVSNTTGLSLGISATSITFPVGMTSPSSGLIIIEGI